VFQKLQEDIRIHVDKINTQLKNFLSNKQMMAEKMRQLMQGKMLLKKKE